MFRILNCYHYLTKTFTSARLSYCCLLVPSVFLITTQPSSSGVWDAINNLGRCLVLAQLPLVGGREVARHALCNYWMWNWCALLYSFWCMCLNKAEVFEGFGVRRRKIKVGRDVAIQPITQNRLRRRSYDVLTWDCFDGAGYLASMSIALALYLASPWSCFCK